MADAQRKNHICRCTECQHNPHSKIAQGHQAVNRVLGDLNERARRLFAGLLAQQRGHGGIAQVATMTGLSRTTIRRGWVELDHPESLPQGRIRRPGGGRHRAEKKARG